MLYADSQEPLYEQLYEKLRQAIEEGELTPGMQLPSERRLAAEHGISRLTARKALQMLRERGYVIAEQGRGTFVAQKSDAIETCVIPAIARESGVPERDVRAVIMALSRQLTLDAMSTYVGIDVWRKTRENAGRGPESEAQRSPVVLEFRDMMSGRSDVYTSGSVCRITGECLRFNPALSDEGVFLVAHDGTEARIDIYPQKDETCVDFFIPPGVDGEQIIEVRTRCGTARVHGGAFCTPVDVI